MLWSWILTAVGILGIWLAGRKSWVGWAVGLEHRDPRDINGGPFCCGLTQLGGIGEDDCHICGEPWPCPSSREV